jgi:hypothetical protein
MLGLTVSPRKSNPLDSGHAPCTYRIGSTSSLAELRLSLSEGRPDILAIQRR